MDTDRSRRELHRGFGEALNRAFEFGLTTLVFFGIGYGLDRWLGTTPLFMIVLTVFALVGLFVRMWFAYDAEMRRHERDRALTGFTVAPLRSVLGVRRRRAPEPAGQDPT